MGIVTTTMGWEMLLRWGHFLGGITWIGLLYYFNLVQTEYFKEADAAAKSDAIQKLVPRIILVPLGRRIYLCHWTWHLRCQRRRHVN
jgi:uncharacterized membrane protein